MAECKVCNKTIKTWEVIGGKCDACFKWSERKKSEAQQELADQELEAIIVTTSHTLQDIEVTKYLDAVCIGVLLILYVILILI